MTNTTNLAIRQTEQKNNLSYVDFAAHAAARKSASQKRALCLQHRYGFALVLLCAAAFCISLATTCTDLTALLVLAPLGVYLLLTKQVLVYRPDSCR